VRDILAGRVVFIDEYLPEVMNHLPTTLELLGSLLEFNTVSSEPNADLIKWVQDLLLDAGASVKVIGNKGHTKANLFATIGPQDQRGFVLSGHTDVVPVAGQTWSVPPFGMTVSDGKVFGRGSADMKGFVACALHAALKATRMSLKTPLHLALSYDEEIGCVGVHSMLDMLAMAPVRPLMCLVGEPTELNVANGHKGKTACHVSCTGRYATWPKMILRRYYRLSAVMLSGWLLWRGKRSVKQTLKSNASTAIRV